MGGPRWKGLKPFFETIPKEQRQEEMDKFLKTYPVFFFEMLTELEGLPFVLENFQISILNDDATFRIVNKTRQAGGSLIIAAAKFWKGYRNEYYRCDIVSFNLKEARGKIKYIRDLWETLPRRWKHDLAIDNTYSIGFHKGNRKSEINSLAASAGVRGGKKDIFFDEASSIIGFDDLYVAALPAIIRGNGMFDIVSTPLGQQGKFWEIFTNQNGKFPSWSRHNFAWFDVGYFCHDIHAARSRWENEYEEKYAFMPDLFEEFATDRMKVVRSEITQEEFNQEFGCEFVDESMAYYPWEMIKACAKPDEPQKDGDTEYVKKWFVRPDEARDHEVYVGIDFAEGKKGGDATSIQVIEKTRTELVIHRAWFDLSYESGYNNFSQQLDFINTEVIGKFKPTRVRIDDTGLGRKLSEDLRNAHGGLIEPVTFSAQSKEVMALNLKGLLEKQNIWLTQENTRLQGQIHNIKRITTANGNIRYEGSPHDDMFWALALACQGLNRRPIRFLTID